MPRKTASWSRRSSASVKSRPQRLLMRNVAPSRSITLDLGVERRSRQAVLGDAVAQHPARPRVGVEERAGVAALQQVEGGGQPGRARADDGHRLAGRLARPRAGSALSAAWFRSVA